jgi:hypothetical protein
MKSLFVVSLPRSLSTTLYYAASRSLRLHEPTWTSAGEILNGERVKARRRRVKTSAGRFTLRESEPDLFERTRAALSTSVERDGFAYKDVVQPFVVAEWLAPGEFCVLKVKRDVAEVAYAMIKRHWHYPGRAARLHRAQPLSLIEGLVRAEGALDSLPGETVHYADALASHEPLRNALQALYPEARLSPIGYIDRRFTRKRSRLEGRRNDSELFHDLRRAVVEVRASLDGEPPDQRWLDAPPSDRLESLSVAASR